MPQLLLVLVFVIFAFAAPLKVTLLTATLLLLITLTVAAVTNAVAGVPTTLKDAFNAVFVSLCLVALALFTLISYSKGAGQSLSLLMLLISLFAAFVLGFKFTLPLNLGASAIVAVLSTGISGALIWGSRALF
jgi:hypothetical protein